MGDCILGHLAGFIFFSFLAFYFVAMGFSFLLYIGTLFSIPASFIWGSKRAMERKSASRS